MLPYSKSNGILNPPAQLPLTMLSRRFIEISWPASCQSVFPATAGASAWIGQTPVAPIATSRGPQAGETYLPSRRCFSPACAPSASPTSCAFEAGAQINVDRDGAGDRREARAALPDLHQGSAPSCVGTGAEGGMITGCGPVERLPLPARHPFPASCASRDYGNIAEFVERLDGTGCMRGAPGVVVNRQPRS
jgi:hypothetical protein